MRNSLKLTCILFLVWGMIILGCTAAPTPTLAMEEVTAIPSQTFTVEPTFASISTPTQTYAVTPVPSTATPTATDKFSPTPEPTLEATQPPTGELPGVQLDGYVTSPDGSGIEGVQIFYAFSAYPGNLLTTTNVQGRYSGFIYIPHDETVRVWAEFNGYVFKPGAGNKAWYNGEFAWHYYNGYENVRLGFIGTPQ